MLDMKLTDCDSQFVSRSELNLWRMGSCGGMRRAIKRRGESHIPISSSSLFSSNFHILAFLFSLSFDLLVTSAIFVVLVGVATLFCLSLAVIDSIFSRIMSNEHAMSVFLPQGEPRMNHRNKANKNNGEKYQFLSLLIIMLTAKKMHAFHDFSGK